MQNVNVFNHIVDPFDTQDLLNSSFGAKDYLLLPQLAVSDENGCVLGVCSNLIVDTYLHKPYIDSFINVSTEKLDCQYHKTQMVIFIILEYLCTTAK